MALKYQINTIFNFENYKINKEYAYQVNKTEAVNLGNGYICISIKDNIYLFDQKLKIIEKIKQKFPVIGCRCLININNHPNLFALKTNDNMGKDIIQIFEVKPKEKLKKTKIINQDDYLNQNLSLFTLPKIDADLLVCFKNIIHIYKINDINNYKKIELSIPMKKDEELLKHDILILKILSYTSNEIFLLIRDLVDMNEGYANNTEIKIKCKNMVYLYDMEKNKLLSYITLVEYGHSPSFSDIKENLEFNGCFSNYQNIFIINDSLVYLKDNSCYDYNIYILDILTGDIKYSFTDNEYTGVYREFIYYFGSFKNSIHLYDNIILFDTNEIEITEEGVIQKEQEVFFKCNEEFNFLKVKDNLLLLYNEKEIKLCQIRKN